MDRNLVVSFDEIHLRENALARQVRREIMDSWDRVTIEFGGLVQSSVVAARSIFSVGFRDHV